MRATRAQLAFFPGDFVATGFRPDGQLHYIVRLAEDSAPYQPNYPSNWYCSRSCVVTTDACVAFEGDCTTAFTGGSGYKSWVDPTVPPADFNGCLPSVSEQQFLACAWGNLGGTQTSVLSVNEEKNLEVIVDGTM